MNAKYNAIVAVSTMAYHDVVSRASPASPGKLSVKSEYLAPRVSPLASRTIIRLVEINLRAVRDVITFYDHDHDISGNV